MFTGKEISRALGRMKISEEECNSDLGDLTEQEMKTLQDWEQRFSEKYTVVGQVRALAAVGCS